MSFSFKSIRKIQVKIALVAGLCLTGASLILIGYSVLSAQSTHHYVTAEVMKLVDQQTKESLLNRASSEASVIKAELDLGRVLQQRLSILGSTLRPRPVEEKAAIIRQFEAEALPHFASGRLAPLIHHVYDLAQAAEAHRAMEASEHFGKLVLRVA